MKFLHFYFFLLLVCFSLNTLNAQKFTDESYRLSEIEKNKKIIKQALAYNDGSTVINSMYNIIALEGATTTYKDSLALMYYNVANYASCHIVAKELLVEQPTNTKLLEINAASLQLLGAKIESITAYEALFAQTNAMSHGYQLAILQFSMKRLFEAQETISKSLLSKDLPDLFTQFPIDKNQKQNVPIKAALYHLKALVAYELKDFATAVQGFKDALKIMPEFRAATENANALTIELQKPK